MYEYRAFITSVYDADTITADIELGFYSKNEKVRLRLYGIDAPEMRGIERPAGMKARDWLRDRILGKPVLLKTYKDKQGKYGRWLAEVFPADDSSKSFNTMLVEEGLAEWKEY